MRVIIVGLGVQGNKRLRIAGADAVAVVDPVNPRATVKSIEAAPLNSYDAALVCTPDNIKLELLTYLLSNKKHVLVEKPLLHTDAELEGLLNLTRQNKVTCYTAYNHRFEPHFIRIKEALDQKTIGKPYLLRMFYGNGTARDVRNSVWRDTGMGLLSDIGSHLLDTLRFWFGDQALTLEPWRLQNFENKSFDNIALGGRLGEIDIQLEASMLSWRNTFSLDIVGETGSLHVDSLCKWGPSTFTHRRRILPSGRPPEESITIVSPDPTWEAEYAHFQKLCAKAESNLKTDIWINSVLQTVAAQKL